MSSSMIRVPDPQFFRHRKHISRKLSKVEKKTQEFYYMVPRFFDMYHPTTTWLVNVIRFENEKELTRVLQDKGSKGLLNFEPDSRAIQVKRTVIGGSNDFVITKAKYFQVIDRPSFYCSSDSRAPLFNRHAVMYLTPLGLAIYLRKFKAARILVQCVDRDTNKKHCQARQPQFITFVNERFGDLMCMYDHNLAMLTEAYGILQLMLQNDNWFPMEPFKMIYRKRFVETYLNFDDFMDYAFYIMFTKRSSVDIPSLVSVVLREPTEHFRCNYMCQPTRANKLTLLRDADRIINNCKSYPRRLLRCAFYADKKLKSTMNLVRAASLFINNGIFKLLGEPAIPFVSKPGRRKRLESVQPYRECSRGLRVEWPSYLYEFDADCCIALLLGLLGKCYRLGKVPTFGVTIRLAVKVLADAGWLNYFNIISDLEFTDYFMGLDDAEKIRFQPEVFGFVRECARLIVIDQSLDLSRFFGEERLDEESRALKDVRDPAVLTQMLVCSDENIRRYVTLEKGEELREAGTVISGPRVRGQGRNDPSNKYYMDRLEFPREATKTVMTNAANTDDSSGGRGAGVTSSSEETHEADNNYDAEVASFPDPGANRSNDGGHNDRSSRSCCSYDDEDNLRQPDVHEFLVDAQVVPDHRPGLRAVATPATASTQQQQPRSILSRLNGSFLPVPTAAAVALHGRPLSAAVAAAASAPTVPGAGATVRTCRSERPLHKSKLLRP